MTAGENEHCLISELFSLGATYHSCLGFSCYKTAQACERYAIIAAFFKMNEGM